MVEQEGRTQPRWSPTGERPVVLPRDYRDPFWQGQANLVRGGTLSPETVRLATGQQLNWLGRTGYANLYPEVFKEFYPMRTRIPSWQEQKIQDLRWLLNQYSGQEGAVIRHLIRNRIAELQYQIDRGRVSTARAPEYEPPPVPEWMKPYVETRTVPAEEPPHRMRREQPETKEVQVLRPLGAQTELTPEQMGYMAGYQAWLEAGAPTRFDENILPELSDWQRYWEYYKRQSQALFPKQQRLAPRWAVARQ